MISKSGEPLLNTNTINALKQKLFPLATVITPNIPEAEFLSSMKINSQKEMEIAAKKLIQFGANSVLIKGGHLRGNEVHDLLLTENTSTWFSSLRVNTPNTHGTGCTLSSALAAFLAMGRSLSESTEKAKHFLYNSLTDGLYFQIGHGHGHGPAKFFCPQKDLVPLEGNGLEPIKVNSNVLR